MMMRGMETVNAVALAACLGDVVCERCLALGPRTAAGYQPANRRHRPVLEIRLSSSDSWSRR
jgi:hypothetical protein